MSNGPDRHDSFAALSPSHTPRLPATGWRWAARMLLELFVLGSLLYAIDLVVSTL